MCDGVFALLHVLMLGRFNTQTVELKSREFFILAHLETLKDLSFGALSFRTELLNELAKRRKIVLWLGIGVLSIDLLSLHLSVILLFWLLGLLLLLRLACKVLSLHLLVSLGFVHHSKYSGVGISLDQFFLAVKMLEVRRLFPLKDGL